MLNWTLLQIKTKIKEDLNIDEEDLISDNEMLGYINEAIDDAEAVIHTLYEDYFMTKTTLSLVNGTQAYSLPSDIYAQKIRKMVYYKDDTRYEILRMKGSDKFTQIPDINTEDDYQYMIQNSLSEGPKIYLYPTSRETDSTAVTLWYIRNAKRLVESGDTCDIPEFVNYVIAHAKVNCGLKANPRLMDKYEADKERMRELMVDTLTLMVPDDRNEIEMDMTHYEEHT